MKLLFYLSIVLAIIVWLFLPDMFPYCPLCGRKKPRPLFKIHKAVSISPGYRGRKSACRKCCRRFSIETIQDLSSVERIHKKIKTKLQTTK